MDINPKYSSIDASAAGTPALLNSPGLSSSQKGSHMQETIEIERFAPNGTTLSISISPRAQDVLSMREIPKYKERRIILSLSAEASHHS